MIHLTAAMAVLSLTHLACLAAISERKYSVRKTAFIYLLFCIVFVCLTAVIYLLFGSDSAGSTFIAFLSTIVMGFFVFSATSKDPLCKKVFLFLSYSNVFCIFQCITFVICAICFPDLSETEVLYARNIMRTLLYVPMAWVYIKLLRPTVREIPGTQKKTWYSISLVSILFLTIFLNFMVVYQSVYSQIVIYTSLFGIALLIYCSMLWVLFGIIRYMINENRMKLVEKNME